MLLHWSPGLRGSDWKLSTLFVSAIKRVVVWDTCCFNTLFSIYAFRVELDLNTFDAGLMHDEVRVWVLSKKWKFFSVSLQNVKGYNVKGVQCSEQRARRNSDCQLVSRVLNLSLSYYFAVCQGRNSFVIAEVHFVQRVLSYSGAGGEMKAERRERQNKRRNKEDLTVRR